jgi:hypothetical protein
MNARREPIVLNVWNILAGEFLPAKKLIDSG